MKVAEGIYRYGTRFHNWYLLEEGGRFTGIDAGCSKDWSQLASALEGLGKSTDDLEAVIISHGHADHVGFAAEAHEHGVGIKIHEDDEFRLAQTRKGHAVTPMQLPLWRPKTIAFLVTLVKAGVMSVPKMEGAETFTDGDVLDVPGRPKVVHTPGHTEGHASFYLDDRKTVFSGDALVNMNLIAAGEGPQIMPDIFHTNAAQARDSLSRLAALDATFTLPGHGDPIEGPISEHVATVLSR